MKKTRDQRTKAASAKRRQAKKADTRRAILDTATELFLAQGKEDFSLRQVAEAAGYTPTTIYLYFKDKDDLLLHAALDGFKSFGEVLQAAYDAHQDPWERLMAEGEAYVRFGLEYPVHYRLMFMGRGEFVNFDMPDGYESVTDSFGVLVKTIQECIGAGILPEKELNVYSNLIWAGVHGIVSLRLANPTMTNLDDAKTHALFKVFKETMMSSLQS